ncbi:sensor-histidine kinase [Streptomyces albus]|uniref:histidine kinase n=1 Tax=Streptomyces albus (strain ATCC 21838 / DSM 41398 / FERM P-419 / JCM 4703 / NBRC 107858) TaxID=1081613 RepID=A0A0B5ESQ0_STRA4|nr:sensor-histidine kinase [Streptomyces albus]AOU76606.1 sensor-histidine kinase [Streptomyces albus]AYN32391.1 sensor histidine kinase [Streptomyces albus]
MSATLPRPHRHDVLIAVAGLGFGLLLWGIGLDNQGGEGLLGGSWVLLPLALMSALELLRRTRPRCALLAGTLALIGDQFTNGSLSTVVMYTDLMYAAVVYGSPALARRLPVATGLITVGVTIGFLAWFRTPEALLVGVVTGLVSFAPACTGALLRDHRDAAEAARLRAEQTALLAEMDRAQAVAAERARMARELHDLVANHLSAIAIHSTAALSLNEEKTTREALAVIRENSVDGLAEMRRLIGILRDDSGEHEPAAAPTLDGLAQLVEGARTNGLDVELRYPDGPAATGGREEPGAALPAPVELAAYRIVQESLTNALKHAAPGRVTVTLRRGPAALEVRVRSPYARRSGPRAPGGGAGLVGMRERVALLRGEFTAEVADGGSVWEVRAGLPLDGGAEPARRTARTVRAPWPGRSEDEERPG